MNIASKLLTNLTHLICRNAVSKQYFWLLLINNTKSKKTEKLKTLPIC